MGHLLCKITKFEVFSIDFKIISSSKGKIVLKSITSTEMFSFSSCSAASRAVETIPDQATNVTFEPDLTILAFPISTSYRS